MPIYQQAEGVKVNGGNFVDISGSNNVISVGPSTRKREGIKLLLSSYVQHEAIHDSDSRGDLGCHPGTREEYIRNITGWGRGEWESDKRAFLMTGPAGAGKSAIARTCARNLRESGNLGASFFFYRPSGWNNPKKFIPTIVYQLTTQYPTYCDCIDAIISDDPLVLRKEMDVQFRDLLIKPLRNLSAGGHGVGKGAVIVIDGLDECATIGAQAHILHLIATSIHEQTTPFLWAFFSRPEPPITSAFSSKISTNVSWTLPLTLSGNAASDIEEYLRGSFQVICAKYSIPAGEWPSEADVHCLVSQSAGLFIYPVTAIRYIDGLGKGTFGLEKRLRAVLELDSKSTDSPFSALDQLYRLVMNQIPEGVLSITLSLLLLYHTSDQIASLSGYPGLPLLEYSSFALNLSSAAFHVAISNLYSVLQAEKSGSGQLAKLQYYHRSFLDFLQDIKRSNQYSICSPAVHKHCLEMIIQTMSNVQSSGAKYRFTLQAFFMFVERHNGKLGEDILYQILQFNWSHFHSTPSNYEVDFKIFISKIPKDWRPRIIRPYSRNIISTLRQMLVILKPGRYDAEAYILGTGDKKGLIVRVRKDVYCFSADLPRSTLTV